MKEYFPHDYNARNDKKLSKVMWKHGVCGIGCFWCIVEMLYEEDGYLSVDDYERIAFELHTDIDLVKSVINDFNLFSVKDGIFFSESAISRLNIRAQKSEKAKLAVQKRWNKSESNTNAIQTYNGSNTIKENKSKLNKRKENNNLDFVLPEFLETFSRWLKYKKDRKENYKSNDSIESAYNKLIKLSNNNPVIAAEIVEQSMANNWAGLFELKTQQNETNRTNNSNRFESDATRRTIESIEAGFRKGAKDSEILQD